MEKHNDILEELKGWNSPLAEISRNMPYAVPQGYFESIYLQLQDELSIAVAEQGFPLSKEMPHAVPPAYFNTLPDNILDAVKQTEALPKAVPFATPEGYFDQLPTQLLDAVKQAEREGELKKTKVIPLTTTIWKNVRWAAAAVLLMGIGFGSYKMTTSAPISTEHQLANVPKSAINDYVDQNIDAFDLENIEQSIVAHNGGGQLSFEQLHEDDIVNYLNETGWNETIN